MDVIALIGSATAPDPLTLAVHWSQPTLAAIEAKGFDPMPKHLLNPLYQADKQAMLQSPLLSSEFVGLGPYRIARWDAGVEIEFVRNDDYYLGRPPLDKVIVKYIAAANTMLANVLAGTLDVASPTVDLQTAADVRDRWQGTGNIVQTIETDRVRFLRMQLRPNLARPANGLRNPAVRRAFYQGLDRQSLSDTTTAGSAPVADSWIAPSSPNRAAIQSAIPQYPYDPARAQQLLVEAGWARGSDGVLVDGATSERFETDIWARPTVGAEQDILIIADQWKTLGANLGVFMMPAAIARDRKSFAEVPLALLSSLSTRSFSDGQLISSSEISSEANQWTGQNTGGYSNPDTDRLLGQLRVTMQNDARVGIERQLVQRVMTDLPHMPLYWQIDPLFVGKDVRGIGDYSRGTVFSWDKA